MVRRCLDPRPEMDAELEKIVKVRYTEMVGLLKPSLDAGSLLASHPVVFVQVFYCTFGRHDNSRAITPY